MKTFNQLILILLFTFCVTNTFAQAKDSLSVPDLVNSSGIIHFEISQSDTITLLLFNNSADTLKTFYKSEVLPSGFYDITFSTNDLVVSTYYVILQIGSEKTLVDYFVKINSSTTGLVDQNVTKNSLILFPNPTNNILSIPVEGTKTIIITNLSGTTLKSFTTDQRVISLLDLMVGQYYITVLNDKKEILTTQKIVRSE